MPYSVKKIIHLIDRITEYSEYQVTFNKVITYPNILGELQDLVPEGVESLEHTHKIVDQPLFNRAGICTLNAETGKYGICNIEVRNGYCLRDIYCPSEIEVDLWITNESLIYNFYNPSELERFTIKAKLIPDEHVFKQISSEPENLKLRKQLIGMAMLRKDDPHESIIERLGLLTKPEVSLLAGRGIRQVGYFIGATKGKEVKPKSIGKHLELLYDSSEIKDLINRKNWACKPIEVIRHRIKVEVQQHRKLAEKSIEHLPKDFQFTEDTATEVMGLIVSKLNLGHDPLKDDAIQEGLFAYLHSIQTHPDKPEQYHRQSAINGAFDFVRKEKLYRHDDLENV